MLLRPLRVLPALAALALLLSGCAAMGNVYELIAQGTAKPLREPPRPVRGTTRVLIVGLDGVSDDVLRAALTDGDMPRTAALLGRPVGRDGYWSHGYAADDVMSVLPAETAVGWAAVYTGQPPAYNGVAGNEWFERDSLSVHAPVPLSVSGFNETLEIYTDDLIGSQIAVPTLFERADVRSHVAMGFVYRGADLMTGPDLTDVGDLLWAGVRFFIGGSRTALFTAIDDDTRGGVLRGFRRMGVPDLQVAYFPGADLLRHAQGGDAQRTYLRDHVDEEIGAVLEFYRRRGALADTYVLFVADHGHTDVLDDDRHSLEASDEGDEPPAVLRALGRRLRPFAAGRDSVAAYDAVMTYDEAMAMVYLADASACDSLCNWQRPPRLQEDVLPVARAFYEAGASGRYVPEMEGTLDLVFARVSRTADGTSPPFQIFDGERLVPVAEYLAAHPRPDLIDLERRLLGMTDGPLGHRAGDVLLLARAGEDRPIEERFYFSSPERSSHGSASASDAYIPFLLAHPGQTGAQLRDRMYAATGPNPTQLSVVPLVLSLLDVEDATGAPLP